MEIENIAISVIMPVYNGEDYLRQSVESILGQTYCEFEFLICDDCSKDKSFAVLEAYAENDDRIKLYRNEKNMGVTRTLNKLIGLSAGQIIARMDADDISEPERLSLQLKHMKKTASGLVFSHAYYIDEKGSMICNMFTPKEKLALKLLDTKNYLIHPTAMIKRSVFEEFGGYNETFRHGQDWELWKRVASRANISILELPLLRYRMNPNSITSRRFHKQNNEFAYEASKACLRCFDYYNFKRFLVRLSLEKKTIVLFLRLSKYYYFQYLKYILIAYSKSVLDSVLGKTKQQSCYPAKMTDNIKII